MKTMAVFLRGINVNGVRITMDELRSVMESMGYKDVKTVLATGNVIVTAAEDETSYEEHKKKIEEGLKAHFGFELYIVLKTAEQFYGVIQESSGYEVPEGCHHYVLLSNENTIGNQLKNLFDACDKTEQEQFVPGKYADYWIVPKGCTLKSDFGSKILGKKAFQSVLTSRTIHTIQKMEKYF